MKVYGKFVLFALGWGILFSVYGAITCTDGYELQALVIAVAFGNLGACNQITVAVLLEKMVPYFLYIVLFSVYIYRHFCDCSVYFFSRCVKRWEWLLREEIKLFAYSLLYMLFMVMGRLLPFVWCGELQIDLTGIIMMLVMVIMLTVWLFTASLLGNILALLFGSMYGVVITLAIQIFSVLSLMWVDTSHLNAAQILKLRLNYSAHLIFSWHKWGEMDLEAMDELKAHLALGESFLFLGVTAVVVVILGMIIISKMDIIQESKEE